MKSELKSTVTLSREKCLFLLEEYNTPAHVVRHCKAVAETALRIGKSMNNKGYDLDLDLLEGAALLHDIVRTEENHGAKAARILEDLGYPEVAKLIGSHMYYLSNSSIERISEQDVLCLSDRMVIEDQYVGLEKRIQYILDKLSGDAEISQQIRYRLNENKGIRDRIEKQIEMSMDELMV